MFGIYQMFVRPEGRLGGLGADFMEGNGGPMAKQAVAHLELEPDGHVLEICFGPSLGLEVLAHALPLG